MILFILLGIVIAVALAILIVKYLPIKFTPIVSIILLGAAGYISYLIYDGIMEPIKFNKEKKVRYVEVIKQLKLIADAEDAYNTITGKFTGDGDGLIKFIDTAQFAITNTHTEIVKENRGTTWSPLMVEVEKKVTDTIGYESVKEKIFAGRNYKNMLKIPNSDKEFKIQSAVILRANDVLASVFQVEIDKAEVLEGMSPSLIKQEKLALGGDEIPGGYITIGSLNEVSTAGNWPPLYDAMASN
ncbi:hypothetical protein [Wenyingzhuangia marina]|uniref:Uncharacterized protein n=1 Tax=Wenyingzhuangia marina TaxID=1195760 RepID=A0A1M5VLC2_9FLAO|nr:hypothetical protein [Wenyingzhuangia marina]GGF71414.1 hypothetical protein GCM10011397_12960 [Wenyingzhuangia marina]SHH75978.1 hypothetical protein SAMN05444281_1890 [Wenyingzhuangia marina]